MNIKTFEHPEFGKIRTVEIDGKWFMVWDDFAGKLYSPTTIYQAFGNQVERYASKDSWRKMYVMEIDPMARWTKLIDRDALKAIENHLFPRRINLQKFMDLLNWIYSDILKE